MSTKVKVTDIGENDAFYGDKDLIVGQTGTLLYVYGNPEDDKWMLGKIAFDDHSFFQKIERCGAVDNSLVFVEFTFTTIEN